MCPSAAAWPLQQTTSSAYGWGGDSCSRAACFASITCNNDGTSTIYEEIDGQTFHSELWIQNMLKQKVDMYLTD